MARIRSLKIGFFTNEQLAALSPFHRLLFAGLWVIADKAGRLEDRPRRIKAELFPYDELNVDQMLTDLSNSGFIARYTARGVACIGIPSFSEHQNPHPKEAESTLPGAAKSRGRAVKSREKNLQATGKPGGLGDLGSGDLGLGNGNGLGGGNARPAGRPLQHGLIDGDAIRRHGGHQWCWFERPSLCVTRYIHEQCTSRLGGDPKTRDSRAKEIYLETKAAIGDAPVGDDALDFWRNIFAAKVGTVTVKPVETRESRTLAAARRLPVSRGELP